MNDDILGDCKVRYDRAHFKCSTKTKKMIKMLSTSCGSNELQNSMLPRCASKIKGKFLMCYYCTNTTI